MIQRKQTLFLLIAVVAVVVCLCLPLATFTKLSDLGEEWVMYNLWTVQPDGTHDFSHWALFAILLLTCPIAILAIFSYHNRITQSRFCLFNILLTLGWYVVFSVTMMNGWAGVSANTGSAESEILPTAVLPAVSIILHFMARKAILADEELVRSADRIR